MITKCQHCNKQFDEWEREDFSCQSEETCLACFAEDERLSAEVLQDLNDMQHPN